MPAALGPLLLLLSLGLASSGFDLFRKLLVRHLAPVPMVVLLALASVPLFGILLALQGGVTVSPGYWLPAAGSVVLNLAANLTFLQAVRISPLSLTVPLLSLTPAFTALLGFRVLGERPASSAVLGIVLVVAGAFWLNLSGSDATRPFWRTVASQPGAWLMAGAALLMSCAIPLDKLAVGYANPPFHGLVLCAGIALGSLGVLAAQRRLGELAGIRQGWGPFLLALVSSTLALGLQLVALKLVLISVVETVKRGVGNLMAIVLGRAVFGEAVTLSKLAAAALMAGGVALIFA